MTVVRLGNKSGTQCAVRAFVIERAYYTRNFTQHLHCAPRKCKCFIFGFKAYPRVLWVVVVRT